MNLNYFIEDIKDMSLKDGIQYLQEMQQLLYCADEHKQEQIEQSWKDYEIQYYDSEQVSYQAFIDMLYQDIWADEYYDYVDQIRDCWNWYDQYMINCAKQEIECICSFDYQNWLENICYQMNIEQQDREAAEAWVKYGDILPTHDYNVFTKWIQVFGNINPDCHYWRYRFIDESPKYELL
jgi:hypothetical protein